MSNNAARRPAVPASELPSSETSSTSGDSTSGQQLERFPLFQPCSATAALFLFAYKNIVYCLHHDTLALERKLVKHKADVSIVAADNVSDRHAGRLAVSYDVGTNAIVWDLFTGAELARFASYEFVRVANWLMDGRLAFGDVQGSITLFEPTTSEHLTMTTIFDPINAIAHSPHCGMFAIGYENGSILVCQLEPSFAILHSLSTTHGPVSIASLAWHGTLTKQKTEMLAVQSIDGDLRVWGVPKEQDDLARMIRVIKAPEDGPVRKAWSAWSKSGRLVQYCDGDTRAWDVRARNITFEKVPTVPGVIGIAVYGPSASLFTIADDYKIQQYDLIGQDAPLLVAEASHLHTIGASSEITRKSSQARQHNTARSDTEGDETGSALSRFQRISKGKEIERYDDEERDKLGPLSPASSKASVSSASSYGRRHRSAPQRHATPGSDVTVFSNAASAMGRSTFSNRDRPSRSGSAAPPLTRSSALRQEILRSPADARRVNDADLFPHIRARLTQIKLKIPQTGQEMTVTDLQREMLSVVFDWSDSITSLLRFEQQRHQPGSAGSVLLSKWLGESGTDTLLQMVGSASMTSSDWMLLALSNQFGEGSARAVGEAFVRRLLETGEVNPAVAILLGMDERDVAVEVYSARQCFLEAVLLNCAVRPYHWDSQTQLLRRWGEALVAAGQTEAAVRCFACASMAPSRGYVSASTTDESGNESDVAPFSSPPMSTPISPPTAKNNRLAAMNAPLKLITNFDKSRASSSKTPDPNTVISLEVGETWRHNAKSSRERSESRTATPGSYSRQSLLSGSTRTASASRHQSESGPTSRAASSQRLGPSTAGSRTPSTVRTAILTGGTNFDIKGERVNSGRQTTHRMPTPDISITAPANQSAEQSTSEQGSPRFLDDISRRVSNVISMQQVHSRDVVQPVQAVRGHARRASDNIAHQRSSPAPASQIQPPGSADVPRRSLDSGTTTNRSKLSTKELAAMELEERRQSLLRRSSIPAIPLPSELVPRRQSNADSAVDSFQGETLTSITYTRGLGIERSATAGPALTTRHDQSFGGYLNLNESTPSSAVGRSDVTSPDESSWLAGSSNALMDGPTLPSTVYQRPAIVRSMTAPPEDPAATAMRRRNSLKPNRHLANIDEGVTSTVDQGTSPSHSRSRPRPSLDADGDVFPELSQPDILARRRQNSSPPPPPPPPPPPILASSSSSPTATPMTMDVPLTLDDSTSPSSARTRRPSVLSTGSRRPSLDRITAAVTRRIRSASRNQPASQSTGSPIARMVSPPYETVLDALDRGRGGQGEEGQAQASGRGGRGVSPAAVVYRHPKEIRDRLVREAREREGGG